MTIDMYKMGDVTQIENKLWSDIFNRPINYPVEDMMYTVITHLSKEEEEFLSNTTYLIFYPTVKKLREAYFQHKIDEVLLT